MTEADDLHPKNALKGAGFVPFGWLRNPHLMTIVPAFIPRGRALQKNQVRLLLPVEQGTELLAICHFQQRREACPTLLLVHGLEGSSDSFYVAGLSEIAVASGFNVVRLNLRNCGDTMHLTPTLYNAGLSRDVVSAVDILLTREKLTEIFLVGWSLGGNLVLKAGAELGSLAKCVSGICAVSPSINLELCVQEIEKKSNRFYEVNFLRSLKNKVAQKAKLFPGRFDLSKLANVKSLRAFDDQFTAIDGGYRGVDHYYSEASALPYMSAIRTPTLVIASKDDPLIPFACFEQIESEYVTLIATDHGGHAGFIASSNGGSRFWADEQIIHFCKSHSKEQR
jgi:predicted alpha/beta-fold hydrolase